MCVLTESDINWLAYSAQRISTQVPGLFPEFYSYWYHAEVVVFGVLFISCLYSLIIVHFFFFFFYLSQACHMCSVKFILQAHTETNTFLPRSAAFSHTLDSDRCVTQSHGIQSPEHNSGLVSHTAQQ